MELKQVLIAFLLASATISSPSLAFANNEVTYFSKWVTQKFPKCKLQKEVLFLDSKMKAKYKIENAIALRFSGFCEKKETSIYIQSKIVRTLNQTLALKIQDKKIQDIKIINFMEPESYKPKIKWLSLFSHKSHNEIDSIDAISGATLTRKSVVKIATDSLNIHNNVQ